MLIINNIQSANILCAWLLIPSGMTPQDNTRSEVVSAEGINSQAPTEVQNMIMSLYVSCLTSNQIIKLFNNYVHVMH